MNDIFGSMVSLGTAVALSPEVLLLGLWLASSPVKSRQKGWSFCLGGVIGLLALVSAGYLLGIRPPEGASWPHFIIRSVFFLLLAGLGIHALFKKEGPHKLLSDHRNSERIGRMISFAVGLLIIAANVKIIALGISAGNKLRFNAGNAERTGAFAVFMAIGVLPLIIPALIETVKIGSAGRIMAPCFAFLERYGRWVISFICFFFGIHFLLQALKVRPW